MVAVALLSACDLWPKELDALADSVSRKVSGETTAMLLGGDVVVLEIAGSPLYSESAPVLEAAAMDIAAQAVDAVEAPLEGIVIGFHEGEISEDADKTREFVFAVIEGRPILQPDFDFDATGPLTAEEIDAAIDRLGEPVTEAQKQCARTGSPSLVDLVF